MATYQIQKGFDLKIAGKAEAKIADAPEPVLVAVDTAEFPGIKPKALVQEGDRVKTGQPLFLDKLDRERMFCAPATGVVKQVVFGERRFLQRVVIEVAAKEEFHQGERLDVRAATREQAIVALERSGLWPLVRQRPLGTIADPAKVPVAIYVNGMDTEPLAADPAFATQGRKVDLQAGVDLLKKLTGGKVHLTLQAGAGHQDELRSLQGVELHEFSGPHPSGLVGTHISRIQPLRITEVAWYLKAQEVALLGEWLRTGRYPAKRVVAVAGSMAPSRQYFRIRQGAALATLSGHRPVQGDVRVINGTVLSGMATDPTGFLGFYNHTVTFIPEGTGQRDLFGWALPHFGKLSASRAVFSWLAPRREYEVDARLNGGHRPIVNIGAWESVTPLDIHPAYLVRAIQANDLEEAVKLGLLEVTEEDVALCTVVDPCKIDVGEVIRSGLELYVKEG
ncbi:MAG: Na(+)-translocating NADH-quinone reductase subunit A [Planctomycetes bacterium]|nr:Na(+)-translocating NADH-quinone reductase subunit A [Planctomycetota bacterium]